MEAIGRRAAIAGALGAAAASLTMTRPAEAAEGDPVILGQDNSSNVLTQLSGPLRINGGSLEGGNGFTLDAETEYVNAETATETLSLE